MKFLLKLMGVLATGFVHSKSSVQPTIRMSVDFPVRMSAESPSNINPSKVISEVSEPYDNPFWEKRYRVKERMKKNNTNNSGLPKLLRWSHAFCSDQCYWFWGQIRFLLHEIRDYSLIKFGMKGEGPLDEKK
jgi:hypothetical protein